MTPEQLKASILQYAIQGKLVEQRPEEGTAEELYQQIIVNQPYLKSNKSDLIFNAVDFDIPETWKWIELNQIYDFVDYRGKTPNKISDGVFLITASNIRQGYMDYTRKEHISREEYETRKSRGITQKGDLLFTTEAPMGNAAICDLDECSCGQRVITFKEYTKGTALPQLFMYFILSPSFQNQLIDNCTGTTAKGIKADKLKHLKLPLPPLEEQHRIVAKIEELLPFVDRYAVAYEKMEQFNAKFPEDMKKSILQYAIQGKLVEQRPEEGTAEDLYKSIQEEKQKLIKEGKIKKEKPLAEITEDEIPFDIPDSWKWVKLGDCTSYAQSKEKISPPEITNDMWSLDLEDIQKETGTILVKTLASERKISGDKVKFRKGQVLYSKLRPYLKKILVAPDDGICTPELVPFNVYGIDANYISYVLKSPHVDCIINTATYGVKMPRVGTDTMINLLIPLPPLEEQYRIVAKIEELLPYCDRRVK